MAHLRSLRTHTVAVRGRTPNLSDIWLQYTARGRTRSNAIARMRVMGAYKQSYPELVYLARGVINQAWVDATPETDRGGAKIPRLSVACRTHQCQALLWLGGSDPDLLFWLELAGYELHHLHHKIHPLWAAFVKHHAAIALTFDLPEWARASMISTAQNGARMWPWNFAWWLVGFACGVIVSVCGVALAAASDDRQ